MKKLLLTCAAIIILAGAFTGGIYYNKKTGGSSAIGNPQNAFGSFQRGQRLDTNEQAQAPANTPESMTRGEIISADEDSITIQTESNGSKIIMLSGSTQISETLNVGSENLTEGKTVMITGETNDDGTISASTIFIREKMSMPAAASGGTEEEIEE